MGRLPSGTVTFLFTDIERSTQTVELIGNERYADLLDTHHQLLREVFVAGGGHEVGMEGDSFFVAFERASDAVDAAVAAQRALESYEWPGEARIRIRIGMHTGEAVVRGADYVGHDVHKAKRISDAGHGGQILLSQVTAELVGADVVDLGPHRLKDLGEPERLYQLKADGLVATFPPLRSLEAFTHNLPQQRTMFVGREREIAELKDLLAQHRLVTLTGVGGCGKTRLALQIGADSLNDYGDGVFFVDLAPVSDPSAIASTVARDIGLQTASGGEVTSTVTATSDDVVFNFLAVRRCLLVLDNCEHLLDACAAFADGVLTRCPDVTILATSREALDVEGEQAWRIPSLSLPDDSGDVQASEAVSLFKVRAKSVRPDFELTPQNAPVVAEICRRLDGIPLALEFAAARIAHLPPEEIADRLGDMFRLLTGGRRRVQRQQTLQAALDWSFELLAQPEQILLRRLAVFAGTFTIAAAEGICFDDVLDGENVLDLLASLVAKSLVHTVDAGGEARYRLIETIRQYASEKLREAGEADVFRGRHRDWYQQWVESFSWEEIYLSNSTRLGLEREQVNLLTALDWSLAEHRFELVVRMANRVNWFWRWGGLGREKGFNLLYGIAIDDLHVPKEDRVAYFDALATFRSARDERFGSGEERAPPAAALLDRAVHEAAGEPSAPLLAALFDRALQYATRAQWETNDPRWPAAARNDNETAERIGEELGEDVVSKWRPLFLVRRGVIELILGDVRAAADALSAGIDASADPDPGWRLDLIAALHVCGGHDRARREAELCIAASHRWRGLWEVWNATPAVGLAGAGDIDSALTILRGALQNVLRFERPAWTAEAMVGFAAVAFLSGDAPRASRLLAWVRSKTIAVGLSPGSEMAWAFYRHYVPLVREALDPAEAGRYRAEGAAMSDEEAGECAFGVAAAAKPSGTERGELTKRELEVAALLADGLANRQIAEQLVVSERTVDAHVDHIRNKLGLRTRAQIASWVTESRLTR